MASRFPMPNVYDHQWEFIPACIDTQLPQNERSTLAPVLTELLKPRLGCEVSGLSGMWILDVVREACSSSVPHLKAKLPNPERKP